MIVKDLTAVKGDDNNFLFSFTNEKSEPQDLRNYDIYFFVKTRLDQDDGDAIITKTKIGGVDAGIEIDTDDTTYQTAIIKLNPEDLEDEAFDSDFPDGHVTKVYKIRVVDPDGEKFTASSGRFLVIP